MGPSMGEENAEQNYLYKKIDSIESRLESHVTKIEQRLDQLVHIMGAVAALQERETRNADNIKEVKSSLKDSFERFEKAIERLHSRLDDMDKAMDSEVEECSVKNKYLGSKIDGVSSEVSKWKDRAFGLWLGLSFLVFVSQGYGSLALKSFTDEYASTKTQVVEIHKKQMETSQQLELLTSRIFPHPDKGAK
jgi:tetrahydromethanopterin S-methyltransferase subunit G